MPRAENKRQEEKMNPWGPGCTGATVLGNAGAEGGKDMKGRKSYEGQSKLFRQTKGMMPMGLQFFAEGDGAAGSGTGSNSGNAAGGEGSTAGSGEEEHTAGGAPGAGGQEAGGPVSFDDFLKDPKNQAEFDRRVGKALETSRSKMQADIDARIEAAKTEAEKLAKMNSEQKEQYEKEKREKELAEREASITKRELTATAKEQLAEKGLPLSLADVLNYDSAETCAASIEAVGNAFQEAVEKAVKERLAGGKPPKKAEDKNSYTMDQIKAMTADEINKNWEAVQAVMKAEK